VASGFKRQYMTTQGWLSEDGILDEMAAWMAAYDRCPALTRREATLATFYLMREGQNSTQIGRRLGISQTTAAHLMKKVRDERGHELPKPKITGYY
jgi:DNA-binding NarL/FixJ family response regulator